MGNNKEDDKKEISTLKTYFVRLFLTKLDNLLANVLLCKTRKPNSNKIKIKRFLNKKSNMVKTTVNGVKESRHY